MDVYILEKGKLFPAGLESVLLIPFLPYIQQAKCSSFPFPLKKPLPVKTAAEIYTVQERSFHLQENKVCCCHF